MSLKLRDTKTEDEIGRIRKRKRGRNMLNRSGNTTDNLCFRYRFRDVFSRFRCCVYNGTGPLFVHVKHNRNMELHVSATFRNTETCDFVLWVMKNWDRGGGLEFICIQMHLVSLAHVKNNVNLKNVKLPKRLQFISLSNYLKICCKKSGQKPNSIEENSLVVP